MYAEAKLSCIKGKDGKILSSFFTDYDFRYQIVPVPGLGLIKKYSETLTRKIR